MGLNSSFGIILVPFFFLFFIDATRVLPPKLFDVRNYGAIADGKTYNTEAFLKAWKDACAYHGRSRFYIAPGTFLLGSVTFEGQCKGSMAFILKGTLKAPTEHSKFSTATWISFRYLDDFTVKGGGYLDGQGKFAWPYNDCSKNSNCGPLPVSMSFDFVNNSRIHHLKSINSKNTHFSIFACYNLDINKVRITAPEDSPNTDGIRIGHSRKIKISSTVIGTGDDCISMLYGSEDIEISNVACGPGHGISVGSLGRSHEEEYVSRISVKNSSFIGTQNGLRIKTWSPSLYSLASDMNFEDISMNNVRNPIVIDQQYCPFPPCGIWGHSSSSAVQIKNVKFRNIWGTSNSKVAIVLKCSGLMPCQDIELRDINLVYNGPGGRATSLCFNVKGSAYGKQLPPPCF
ncbi:exopolygalacturonase-like [Olea europaea subsp. europaea]|uniref:Exopolygalacturonase-like n=1 Tax=Olea europaea subsp. europaea TaxID=158383 RepID=A0A8S0TUA0_OLEEU|nr:exopolygalacturonase-like [Olea europaea subsp. europaea]